MSIVSSVKQKSDYDFRPCFHFTAPFGWMNDPNGFSVYGGNYHLFYQSNPFSTEWGLMHWGHAISEDLVKWNHLPIALAPDSGFDNNGCFSGSAMEIEGRHLLMYTGISQIGQEQCIAFGDGIRYLKDMDNPVIKAESLPKSVNAKEFRDPKIFVRDGIFYCLLSTQLNDGRGALVLFRGADVKTWEFISVFDVSLDRKPGVWECADLFELNGYDVLLASPQGMTPDEYRFHNFHSALYKMGHANLSQGSFTTDTYDEIDYGFDFYAPQTLLDSQGRRIMIAWMQMWGRSMPTHELGHGWAGVMTLPRELSIKNGVLLQAPIKEIESYRKSHFTCTTSISGVWGNPHLRGRALDIIVVFSAIAAKTVGVRLFCGVGGATVFSYDVESGVLTFDRRSSGMPIMGKEGELSASGIRKVKVEAGDGQLTLRFLVDGNSVEAFIQDGRRTMTGTVYPKPEADKVELFAEGGTVSIRIDLYNLAL